MSTECHQHARRERDDEEPNSPNQHSDWAASNHDVVSLSATLNGFEIVHHFPRHAPNGGDG